MATDYRYSDLDFRMRKLTSGEMAKVYDEKAINQSLLSLFSTVQGERFFNPAYGTIIPKLLFEPFDEVTANQIVEEVKYAVATWEPRVSITDLTIQLDNDNSLYVLDLIYQIKSTTEIGELTVELQKQ